MVIAIGLSLVPGTAYAGSGGGWWTTIDLRQSPIGVGEELKANATVMFESIALAETATVNGIYYAYLLENFDYGIVRQALGKPFNPDWWQVGDATAIRAGSVEFKNFNRNLVDTAVHLEVPDVPSGRYALMLCDAGCVNPLADLIPTRVTVVATAAEARVTRELAGLRAKVAQQSRRFGFNLRDLGDLVATEWELQLLEEEISEAHATSEVADRKLQKNLDAAARESSRNWYDGLIWLVAGSLLGTLATLFFVRRKRSSDQESDLLPPRRSSELRPEESISDELTPVG